MPPFLRIPVRLTRARQRAGSKPTAYRRPPSPRCGGRRRTTLTLTVPETCSIRIAAHKAALVGALLLLAAGPSAAGALACLIEPSRVVNVGSPVAGVIASVAVERGDTVRAGARLATLRSDVERASLDAAQVRSQAQADLRAAEAASELARSKYDRARELREQNFVSEIALEQARSEAQVAERRVEAAREQRLMSQQDEITARSQLRLRELSAPMDGVVVERFLNPGERVDDKPVMRLARLDPLRVELILPLAQLGRLSAGDAVSVRPEYPGAPVVRATVERVDRIVDAASRTFRARLVLPNPGLRIVAGVRCSADWPGAEPARSLAPVAGTRSPAAVNRSSGIP
jgi:membrane fusion protein, heavy metal efflux system